MLALQDTRQGRTKATSAPALLTGSVQRPGPALDGPCRCGPTSGSAPSPRAAARRGIRPPWPRRGTQGDLKGGRRTPSASRDVEHRVCWLKHDSGSASLGDALKLADEPGSTHRVEDPPHWWPQPPCGTKNTVRAWPGNEALISYLDGAARAKREAERFDAEDDDRNGRRRADAGLLACA